MCGIIGGNIFSSKEKIKDGMISMFHRGTDQNVLFSLSNEMYLGHNRLSIQDLSEKAKQPMASSCGRYYLVFNGELWKSTFEKFNKELRTKYDFKTKKSDTELLLYFLIEYKDNLKVMLRQIEGMFAFAFYDRQTETLTLSRDFVGRVPLYYYYDGNKIAFASEVKGLIYSIDELKYYRINRNSPKEEKLKEKIKSIPPGTLFIYKAQPHTFFVGSGEITQEIWFSFKEDKNSEDYLYVKTEEELSQLVGEDKGIEHYSTNFKKLLWKAVEDEMIADVPVCTILSGGIDSTIITYILAQINPNLEAFVVHIGEDTGSKDDLYYARLAAQEIGIKLNEVYVTQEQIEETLDESIWACEGYDWRQVSCSVAQLFLAKEVRKRGFKVVFGGEGADEIFASYNDVKRWAWHLPVQYHQKRVNLINHLHQTNLIRCNKVLMYGGEIELRTPFMNRELVKFGLTIPVIYRDNKQGKGNRMKYVLRKAFENDIKNEELLWRPKVTMQIGCHTDFLKSDEWKDILRNKFREMFINEKIPNYFIEEQFREFKNTITIEEVEDK